MFYDKESIVFSDGNFEKAKSVKIDLFSQSFQYGNCVFEGIRSYETADGTVIFRALSHYNRFLYSANKMGFHIKYTAEELANITYELLEKNKLSNAYIRPLAFAGQNIDLTLRDENHLMIGVWGWDKYYGSKPIDVKVSTFVKPSSNCFYQDAKVTGHYISSILATTDAKRTGFDEAILLDDNGYVAQASTANLFYQKEDVLYTPKKDKIFPGITREIVKELAMHLQVEIKETQFTKQELYKADGIFLTGTAPEVHLVKSIDGRFLKMEIEDTHGFELQRMYRQMVTRSKYHHSTFI